MSYTDQDLLDSLREQYYRISQGIAQSVFEGGTKIEYPQMDKLLDQIARLERKIAAASGNVLKPIRQCDV